MLFLREFERLLCEAVYGVGIFPGERGWLLAAEPAALTCRRKVERLDGRLDRVPNSSYFEDIAAPVVLSAGENGGVDGERELFVPAEIVVEGSLRTSIERSRISRAFCRIFDLLRQLDDLLQVFL